MVIWRVGAERPTVGEHYECCRLISSLDTYSIRSRMGVARRDVSHHGAVACAQDYPSLSGHY